MKRTAISGRPAAWLVLVLDGIAFSIASARLRARRQRSVDGLTGVVLMTSGGGNIGDDALLEAVLHHRQGPVRVLGTSAPGGSFSAAPDVTSDPGAERLLRGNLLARFPAVVRLAELVLATGRLDVIGADVMDGGYNPLHSVQRWSIARSAGARGVATRILGFSWSDAPSPGARAAMQAASRHAELFARDPVSLRRLVADGAHAVRPAADVVFTMSDGLLPQDIATWISEQRRSGRRVAAVNVSGLVAGSFDQVPGLVTLVREWLDHEWSVLLVPHVWREGDDDVVQCRRVADHYADVDRLRLVERRLLPVEVRGVGAAVDVVVSARMHLSVMALAAGTPAVTVDTQGKVEGLCELAQPLAGMVRTGDDFVAGLRREFDRVTGPGAADGVTEVPARLRELAAANFAG
jgi:colanic acid/amylovoran biosynthesis protein